MFQLSFFNTTPKFSFAQVLHILFVVHGMRLTRLVSFTLKTLPQFLESAEMNVIKQSCYREANPFLILYYHPPHLLITVRKRTLHVSKQTVDSACRQSFFTMKLGNLSSYAVTICDMIVFK